MAVAAAVTLTTLEARKLKHPFQLEAEPSVICAGTITLDRVPLQQGEVLTELALAERFRSNSSEAVLAAAKVGLHDGCAPRAFSSSS